MSFDNQKHVEELGNEYQEYLDSQEYQDNLHNDCNMFTHDGCVTMRNPATGGHRTVRVRTQPEDAKFAPGSRVLSLLVGSDNESSYQGFGFLNGERVNVYRKHRGSAFEAIAHILEAMHEHVENGTIEFMFEARCRRCGRKLTTPESIKAGIGPVCESIE